MKMTLACILAVLILTPTLAMAAHPIHGHKAKSLKYLYGPERGLPTDWSLGDVTFSSEYPDAEGLTEEEKYVIAGASTSDLDMALEPWTVSVFKFVDRYYSEYGYVPTTITPDVIRVTPGYELMLPELMEVYRNPLTDRWPRLDATSPAPGDMYIKPLSLAEMHHFADLTSTYQEQWFGEKGGSNNWDGYLNSRLLSPVYYVRVYGYGGVIHENLTSVRRTDVP